MKVIIQNLNTQLYPTPTGGWTANAAEAKDYTFSIHATAVGRRLGLKNFDVLLFFPELDYQVPVSGARANDSEESSLVA